MWYIYAIEYYSAIERNKILIHSIIRMNFENMVVSQTGKVIYDLNYRKYSEKGNPQRQDRLVVAGTVGRGEWGMTANGYSVSLG